MWVAILVSKDMMELLSLISVGKEFQMCAPSNMKLFFILLNIHRNNSGKSCPQEILNHTKTHLSTHPQEKINDTIPKHPINNSFRIFARARSII
jgi:hypothetical protein